MSKPGYDPDQLAVINSQSRIVVAEARAGAGKTHTAVGFAEARPNKKILYICLNKANQTEAQRRFPANVKAITTHALAFSAVGKHYGDRLVQSWKAQHVADALGLDLRQASVIHSAMQK